MSHSRDARDIRLPLTELRLRQRRSLDPARLYYSPRWLAAGGIGGLAWAAAALRFGPRFVAASAALGGALLGYMRLVEPRRPQLTRLSIELPRLRPALSGLRIGHISDAHLGFPFTADTLAWAVAEMRRERPDIIALTGDFVSYRSAIPQIAALLRGIAAPLGVYAVAGNHDHWEGIGDVRAALELCGVRVLLNEHVLIEHRGARLAVAGVDDVWDGQPSLERTLCGVPPDVPTVLLCHAPDVADDPAERGVDLQLSGHAHGGHFRLPLLGPFAMPRYGRRYVMGLHQIGAMRLFVSRGIGGAPLRLGCPPEAALLTLMSSRIPREPDAQGRRYPV